MRLLEWNRFRTSNLRPLKIAAVERISLNLFSVGDRYHMGMGWGGVQSNRWLAGLMILLPRATFSTTNPAFMLHLSINPASLFPDRVFGRDRARIVRRNYF